MFANKYYKQSKETDVNIKSNKPRNKFDANRRNVLLILPMKSMEALFLSNNNPTHRAYVNRFLMHWVKLFNVHMLQAFRRQIFKELAQ